MTIPELEKEASDAWEAYYKASQAIQPIYQKWAEASAKLSKAQIREEVRAELVAPTAEPKTQ